MKRSIIFSLFVMVFCSLSAQDRSALLASGKEAPQFSLKTVDGTTVNLSSYKGQYLLLDFWASWCGDCRKEIPAMKQLYAKYGKKVAFLGVSFDDEKEPLENCIKTNDITWTQCSEFKKWKETTISKAYGINWIPSMYLIGKDGKVITTAVTCEEMEPFLKNL